MTAQWRRLLPDLLIPVAIAVLGTLELVSLDPAGLLGALVLEWGACLALVWRRKWPLSVAVATCGLLLAMPFVGPKLNEPATPILAIALAVYCAGRYVKDLRGVVAVAVVFAAAMAVTVRTSEPAADLSDTVFILGLLTPPYVLGRLLRAFADRNVQLTMQARLLAEHQEVAHRAAVSAERQGLAREMHDVIAHSVSAMVVQAAAAEEVLYTDPDRAAQALRAVSDTGRQALVETGHVLRLMRDSEGGLGLEPEVGLGRLSELVGRFRDSGLAVDVSVHGSLEGLPAGVDVSGYRIVQEALTNALRHASDRAVRLRIVRDDGALSIHTDNDLAAVGPPAHHGAGSGLGLVGMAERISVFGGTFTHGPTHDGRFELAARLPFGEVGA